MEIPALVQAQIHASHVKRLWQVLRVVHVTLVLLLILNAPLMNIPILITLALGATGLTAAYIPLRKGNTQAASDILIGIIGLSLCVVMWHGSGLRSSGMFAYPGLLMFCLITGNERLFRFAYFGMVLYMVFLHVATQQGWRVGTEHPSSIYTLLEFLVVVSTITYIVKILAGDLFALLNHLDVEMMKARESQSQTQHVADHDNLTGLPNRRVADQRFQEALDASLKSRRGLALVFMDIDNFKIINDSMGHQAGDDLLQTFSQTLSNALRKTDTLIRHGGDEFLLIIADTDNQEEVTQVLEKLLATVRREFTIDGNSCQTSCSMGVVLVPEHGTAFNELLRKADIAMYRAKAAGRDCFRFYDENLD